MANSELYGKTYSVPPDVIEYIQKALVLSPQGNGVRRAKFITKNGVLTYQELKRLKNFFDRFNPQLQSKYEYTLAGGAPMRNFINNTLQTERDAVEKSREVTQDMHIDVNLGTQPYQTPRLNEEKTTLKKNAIAIIANNDDKFLLLKRTDAPDVWQPGKWALVGGAIEKGESPEIACKREVKEETGLDVDNFIKTFSVQRSPESIEYVFAARYDGDPTDIILNSENTNYGWYDIPEMKFLETVPNLVEYITLAFTGEKYD